MNIDLSNKCAMVCGSTRGMGKATAIELAKLGATITLVARNEISLTQVRDELVKYFPQKHDYICADFNDPETVRRKVHTYLSKNKKVFHILVNNTGGPPPGQAIESKPEHYIKAFRNHLICNQILTQALVPGMKSQRYGRIINIISTSVKQPIRGLGVSNTIRGAVASWAKTLAMELGPFGITVNNVLPGATNTTRLNSLLETMAKRRNISLKAIKNEWMSQIPAGRIGEPEEIAQAIAFLASPAASYINGINLPVDGGRLQCL